MRANEFITEVFQSGKQNWEWKFRGSEEAIANFTVGGRTYQWVAYSHVRIKNPTKWEIQFRLLREDNDPDDLDLFGTTGTGNSAEVLSTAVDITRTFLKEYGDKVLEITFNAKENSRIGLYAKMINRLLPDWDLHQRYGRQHGMEFYLTNPKAYELHSQSNQVDEEEVNEMALKQFTPMGDFNKPGPFKGVDKRLVPHPTNQLKTQKFFEQTPYDFRLFFSNIPGTGKYSETGSATPQQLQQMFGEQAKPIIEGSEDAITVVFVGNSGDSKVMMTPWIMAHRIGHAIQASERRGERNGTWKTAEQHFFSGINNLLADFYGKKTVNQFPSSEFNIRQQAEYNALFNAIGTQRSSRAGEIKRPYEFMYELFAQYLGTGNITLKPLPKQQDYGRKAWGRSIQSLNMRGDMQDESAYTTETLARDMELMFDDVLSSLVGKILVM